MNDLRMTDSHPCNKRKKKPKNRAAMCLRSVVRLCIYTCAARFCLLLRALCHLVSPPLLSHHLISAIPLPTHLRAHARLTPSEEPLALPAMIAPPARKAAGSKPTPTLLAAAALV